MEFASHFQQGLSQTPTLVFSDNRSLIPKKFCFFSAWAENSPHSLVLSKIATLGLRGDFKKAENLVEDVKTPGVKALEIPGVGIIGSELGKDAKE